MVELGFAKRDLINPICRESSEVMVRSAMEGNMGRVWIPSLDTASFCLIKTGEYVYLLGLAPKGTRALDLWTIISKQCSSCYIIPENESWIVWLEENLQCNFRRISRYALKKDEHHFNVKKLRTIIEGLPSGFIMKKIDANIYTRALKEDWSKGFVYNFEDGKQFEKYGFGYVITKGRELISGCSTYGFCTGMTEVVTATKDGYRKKGFASCVCAAFVLDCIEKSIFPNWDAANLNSVALAEKLGYVFDKEYTAFEIE